MSALAALVTSCMLSAAQIHGLPPSMLFVMLHIEGGKIGETSRNTNGTFDIGPMQINSIWIPELARRWKKDHRTTLHMLTHDACTNIEAGAWILRGRIDDTRDTRIGISRYHSATPHLGSRYFERFVAKASEIDRRLAATGQTASGDFLRAAMPRYGNAPASPGSETAFLRIPGAVPGSPTIAVQAPPRILEPIVEGEIAVAMTRRRS